MIKIIRGPAPEFLFSTKVMAEKEKLKSSFENVERQERFRFDISILKEVRESLLEMCNGKCAYCESSIGISSPGDIENFRPKAGARSFNSKEYAPMHYWWLAYEWDNLLISCKICNTKYKRDFFPIDDGAVRASIGAMGDELLLENPLLIDPCVDNPDDHIDFEEDGLVRELTKKGKVTIEILGLNRKELVKSRKSVAKKLIGSLELVLSTDVMNRFIGDLVDDVKELFSDHPHQEYAGIQRRIFDKWYEKNFQLWDSIKIAHNDLTTKERLSTKFLSENELGEISKVDLQLSSIKRFSIKSVLIENFKSIEKITLSVLPINEKDNRESWLLLLGDNGIGKSSILQAVALALAGKNQLDKLQLDVSDFLRRGADKGKIVIQSYEHDNPVELHFDENGFRTELTEPPTFLLGYGSTRLLPKGKIQPDLEKLPYLNISNLFDYSVALNDPNIWLSSIDPKEYKERVAPAFFDVLALRGNDKVWVDQGKIIINQFGDDHELEDNSDGYKTITALVSDMMQTLSEDQANYHNSQGIVLIDEIGNHLHPRWRMKIVAALRKAFPKLQFIVTTHEPLCLRGLSHGEVIVLVRDQNQTIKALDQQLLPDHSLMSIEQLLTSDLFGLINVLDEETEKTYEEYYFLLSKKEEERTQDDQIKMDELTAQLAKKEILGNTPQEQAFYKIINDEYAENLRKQGFKTTEQLKDETIKDVKKLLTNKKISWL